MSAPKRPTLRRVCGALALVAWLALVVSGCQAANKPSPRSAAAEDTFWTAVHREKQAARHEETSKRTGGTLQRAELVGFLERGPAHLLGQVPVMPVLDAEQQLIGYRIEAFFPDSPVFHRVDIASGDVVTAVNGVRIERPEHLFELYEALRTAPRLQIDVMRDDTLRTLTWEIVDSSAAVGEN